jgi:DNA replication protein DnaC
VNVADTDIPAPVAERQDVECACGRVYPQVWYDLTARREAGKYVPASWGDGRWVSPQVSPCAVCAQLDPFERVVLERLRKAKVPAKYHAFRLQASHMLNQRDDELDADFRVRCKAMSRFGVTKGMRESLRSIRAWLGVSGDVAFAKPPERWLVLHGTPGTGKTAVLSAIARCLLSVPPLSPDDMPRARIRHLHLDKPKPGESAERWQARCDYAEARGLTRGMRRHARKPEARYVDASDLLRRVNREFGRKKEDEADGIEEECVHSPVLLLDELGATSQVSEGQYNLFERLLRMRHNDNRLTVVATNRTWAELTTKGSAMYGDAVADRLRSGIAVPFGGDSWR